MFEKLTVAHPLLVKHTNFLADTHRMLADTLVTEDQLDEAEQSYRQGIAVHEDWCAKHADAFAVDRERSGVQRNVHLAPPHISLRRACTAGLLAAREQVRPVWAGVSLLSIRTRGGGRCPKYVGFPRQIQVRSASFRRPKTRFRGNVWESGTQNACRKTCEFPVPEVASLISWFSPQLEKRMRS